MDDSPVFSRLWASLRSQTHGFSSVDTIAPTNAQGSVVASERREAVQFQRHPACGRKIDGNRRI